MKKYYVILLCLFSFCCFSQKSEQVKNYLGENRFLSDKPNPGTVNFIFQKGNLKRKTDGSKTFYELLFDATMYSDADNAGALTGITENGILLKRYEVAKSEIGQGSARPINFQIPDSAAMIDQFENLKKRGTFWESKMWSVIRPGWELVMHFFWILFPLLLLIAGILWFWAGLSASEEFSGLHYKSSKSLTLLVGSIWTVFFINIFMTLVSWEMGIVGLSFCFILLVGAGLWSAAWIIPNFRQKANGRPHFQNNTQRQLN